MATLSSLISEKLAELKETVALRQNEGFKAALKVVETNRGKHTMDDVRSVGEQLQNEVYTGLMQGIRERQEQGSNTRLTTALGAAVLFGFLLLATFDIGRANRERDRLIVDLGAANDPAPLPAGICCTLRSPASVTRLLPPTRSRGTSLS